jgi:hypothetical protein
VGNLDATADRKAGVLRIDAIHQDVPLDVKLADSLGDRAWVCLTHAEEILVTVPMAFIASHG